MKQTFNFGKIDFYGCGRKINLVTIEMEYKTNNSNKKSFSVCGDVWNAKHTDVICCGQCLDTIAEYMHNNKKFNTILRLWRRYHLNDMHTGTPKQERAIIEMYGTLNIDYDIICMYLKHIKLYDDNGYKYGHGWLYEAIPEDDEKIIIDLMINEMEVIQ